MDEVVGECDMTESAIRAATFNYSAGDRDQPHAQASVHDGNVD